MTKSKAQRLRELLHRDGDIPFAIGCYDGITARLVQESGFEVALMSGYGVAGSVLGGPDYGMITMTEMCTQAHNMNRVIDIPLIGDGDTGYGNPLNVRRTVMEYEQAGCAAIQLEDQLFPKRCGHMDGKEVIPVIEHCRKIEMAAATRHEMLILARTDSCNTHGSDEAVKRIREYAKAGADFVLVDAPPTLDDLKKIGQSVDVPIMVNMVEGGKTAIMPSKELKALGFSLICYPTFMLFSAVYRLKQALAQLREEGTSLNMADQLESFKSYTALVGLPQLQELEKKYKVVY